MTKLTDQGYLETDDPVVAACFLEHDVVGIDAIDPDATGQLQEIAHYSGKTEFLVAHNRDYLAGCSKLLIPASVVAEAWSRDETAHKALTAILGEMELARWIVNQTHFDTQESNQ